MSQTKEVISTLNSLIETLKDGQEGFRQAAEAVKDSQLKSLFNELSMQRSKFAGELQSQVIQLGEPKPENTSSTAGALHRAWINMKAAITTSDDHAILAECERGEDSAVAEYKKAMADDSHLSSPIRETVSQQYTAVKTAHDRVKALRDASKNAS
ncbi:MAG: PA2169 family four-helix-bundle protein [Verrucomicrobiota bacterium]|nr:PA2169 family four-helix-bundle protein [Verrucomicrobiota bacterium]